MKSVCLLHSLLMATALSLCPAMLQAASLPAHMPIDLLIVADEVNPHKLADADLTQPQDLAPALTAADSPLANARVTTVNSQCADDALKALQSAARPAVVLYFAHRAAKHCDGSDAQPQFTQLMQQGLQSGMGVVVLHHGLYVDIFSPGAKDELLALIGAKTNSIKWDTVDGQRVYNVGGNHFVSNNGLSYPQQASFTGTAGVAAGALVTAGALPQPIDCTNTMMIGISDSCFIYPHPNVATRTHFYPTMECAIFSWYFYQVLLVAVIVTV